MKVDMALNKETKPNFNNVNVNEVRVLFHKVMAKQIKKAELKSYNYFFLILTP